jgi:hypothetical protein
MAPTDRSITDLAATCQGWSYALNTVARPAAEHLEAAQAALSALERTDNRNTFPDVHRALSEALSAARARLAPQSITIAELRGALDELTALGLTWPEERNGSSIAERSELADWVHGLEASLALKDAELDEAERTAADLQDQLEQQRQLRDRFEREAREERQRGVDAHRGHSAAVDAARRKAHREASLWILRAFGMNPPGFDQMPDDELATLADTQLASGAVAAEVVQKLEPRLDRAWSILAGMFSTPEQRPADLADRATRVIQLADKTRVVMATLRDEAREAREAAEEAEQAKLYADNLRATARAELEEYAREALQLRKERDQLKANLEARNREVLAVYEERNRAATELERTRADNVRLGEELRGAQEDYRQAALATRGPLTPPESGPLATGD